MKRPTRPGRRWWWLALLGVPLSAVVWLRLLQPVLEHRERWPDLLAAVFDTTPNNSDVTVTFELGADSAAVGAVMLREPGYRGVPSTTVVDLGALTPVSGVVLLLPPALHPASDEDGARLVTLALFRDGRELGVQRFRFDSLGAAVRVRPSGRLAGGDYDVRVAIASRLPSEPPVVVFYRLRVR